MSRGAAILRELYEANGRYTLPGELASSLRATGEEIMRRVEELRALGFDIESHPHRGIRLVSAPDRLTAEDLEARLSTRCIGREIGVFEETDSTNDLVHRFAREGRPEGLVIFADGQRRGRGRQGRSWVSPPGCALHFSFLLRPVIPARRVPCLTLGAAAAVAEAIRERAGLHATLKWPNDVRIRGRKVAGILTETVCEGERIVYAVVGVGINVNTPLASFPPSLRETATSLAAEREGRPVSRPDLAASVLERIDDLVAPGTESGRWERLTQRFERLCDTLGAAVAVRDGTRITEGDAVGIDEDGSLLVRTAEGRIETVRGGEVREVRYEAG